MTDTGFIETDERWTLRSAVAAMACNYGEDYYLEKARAGEHTTELWTEQANSASSASTSRRSTAAAGPACTSCRW